MESMRGQPRETSRLKREEGSEFEPDVAGKRRNLLMETSHTIRAKKNQGERVSNTEPKRAKKSLLSE